MLSLILVVYTQLLVILLSICSSDSNQIIEIRITKVLANSLSKQTSLTITETLFTRSHLTNCHLLAHLLKYLWNWKFQAIIAKEASFILWVSHLRFFSSGNIMLDIDVHWKTMWIIYTLQITRNSCDKSETELECFI